MWLIFLCLAIAASAQESEAKRVDIKGTVVNSATGQPIAGASVVLNPGVRMLRTRPDSSTLDPANRAPGRMERSATTDEGGAFAFQEIVEVGWSVSVSHRGYRAPEGGDIARAFGGLGEGGPITVKLDPLGVIEGKIVNEDGEPLSGVTVELLQVTFADGFRNVRRYATKNTDDLGAYRLWYLSPGSYYLKVAGRRGTSISATATPQVSQSDEAYGPVYFPTSPDREGARLINLGPGESIHADFDVTGHASYRIRGKFLVPIANRRITIRLLRGDDEMGNRAGINSGDGTFQVFDVSPGAYTLQAYTGDTGDTLFGETQVSIGNGDLTGVILTLSGAVSVEGTVEGTGQFPAVQISVTHSNPLRLPAGLQASSMAVPSPDGRFTVANLWPGHYEVSARSMDLHYVSSIQSGSIDLFADGLSIGSGPVESIKVRRAEGGGSIKASLEKPEAGVNSFQLAIVPKAGTPGCLVITPMAAAANEPPDLGPVRAASRIGRGSIPPAMLAPGEYSVIAWRSEQHVAYRNPAVLQGLSTYAVTVTVGAGETKVVKVPLIPKGDY